MAVNGSDIVNYLLQFKGTPYVWGGTQPGGFDCSGLMVYGFKKFGINLPRVTYDQIGVGQAIGMNGLRPGDLVFFETDDRYQGPDHVGIYMGNGEMFHTPRPGKVAEIVKLQNNSYYASKFVGGRRIAGVVSNGASSSDWADPETQRALTPEEMAANYGWNIAFMNSIPEVKKLFDSAVKESWTPQKFQAALRDTKWWKTTSAEARKAQVMKTTDPATWNATAEATKLQLLTLATKMGAAIPEGQIKELTETILMAGMQEDQIRDLIGEYVKFTQDGTLKGEAGMFEYTIKTYAAAMGVQMTDEAIKNGAARIVKKLQNPEDYRAEIREMAKSAFPGYTTQIDAGLSVKDLAFPFIQVMAQELEIPLDSINVDDPTIKAALNGVNADGKPTGLPLYEFQKQLRNDPRWRKGQGSQQKVMKVGTKVLKDMGLI